MFSVLSEVGLYQMGASFGMALKLVLNAFEYAWAPFYFQTMKTPDAKATFRLITTYGIAVIALLVAGLAATGPEIVRWVLPAEFHGAARIVPWIAIARHDQDLGRSRDEVDPDLPREQLLRGGDVDIARPDDAVGARHGLRSECEGGDGLRAAHLKDLIHTQHVRCREDFGNRFWRRDANIRDARDLRRDHGHHHRRG